MVSLAGNANPVVYTSGLRVHIKFPNMGDTFVPSYVLSANYSAAVVAVGVDTQLVHRRSFALRLAGFNLTQLGLATERGY